MFCFFLEKEIADGQCATREIVPNHSVNSSHSSNTGFSHFSQLCQVYLYVMPFSWPSILGNFLPAKISNYHHHLPKPDSSSRFGPNVPTLGMSSLTRCPFQPASLSLILCYFIHFSVAIFFPWTVLFIHELICLLWDFSIYVIKHCIFRTLNSN